MNNLDFINKENEKEDVIRNSFENVKCYDWVFCVHTHYKELRVSAWKGKSSGVDAMFSLNNDRFEVYENREHLKLSEPENRLNKWLQEDFNDMNKCTWHETTAGEFHEGWQPKCSPDDLYVSGGISDLQEMKATYTYCPKCSKEIDFKINEGF